MLHFILGRAGSGKTSTLRTTLKDMAEATSKKLMLIVPEQSSFENERAMLHLLGEKNIQRVSVTSFSRLADTVYRTYGGGAGRRLDDGGRSIFMSLALEQVKDNLNFYRKNADSTELVDLLLLTSAELKMCNITPFDIENTARGIEQSTLKQKMTEISLILSSYDALVSQSYIDPLDDLTRIKNILEVHNFFEGYTVALDSFESFTVQEYNIIKLILAQADDLYVSLCADKLDDPEHGMGLFSLVRRTAKNLERLAKDNDVKIASPIVLNSSARFKSSSLCTIEENAYRFNHKSVSYENNDDVVIYEAQNKYDESEYVSATIRRLVINEGFRYRDFAVISRSPDSYRGILDSALERWKIPYFMDKPQPIDFEPIMRLVLSAFKIVQTGFSSDSIFTYLKTGLTGLNTYEISQLENYIFTWKISGAKWKSEWSENPKGFSDKMTEYESNALQKINESRDKVIRPLMKFSSKIQNATGEEIASASFELLQDIEAPKHLRKLAKRLETCGEAELADRQLRLWDLLMNILDQTALVLGTNKIKYTRYAELLHIVILANNMASIPQGLDEVTVGAADRTKTGEPKIVFIIGTIQGEFPLSPSGGGIFSDSERRKLIDLKLPLNDTLKGVAVQERFLAYKAMSAASEKLFITYPISGLEGEANSPSSIPNEAGSILNISVKHRLTLPPTYFANAKEPCFELMAQQWKHNTPLSATLKNIFNEHESYKVNSIERSAQNIPKVFEDSAKARDLFGNDLKLSATQIEKFYLCPFQYFCRFGLNVKERKAAEMDALEYGSLMHYLLEKILRKYSSKKINDMKPQELKDEIIKLLNEYLNVKMGGEENRTPRFLYLFKRIAESACIIISHIAQELCQSKFEPVDFELPIGMGEIKPLIINLPNGGTAEIDGKIDRVDIVNLDDEKYVRVVDYKTGHRDFKLSDIIYGINMQMLIYLAALIENGNEKYGNIKPAGVLYMPANRPDVSVSRSETEEKIKKESEKKLRMDGLILDDAKVIFAMEEGGKGRYIPVTLKDGVPSKREHVATSEELTTLKKYIKSLISDMAELLHSGNVEALPLSGEYNACDWCPYSAVCGHEKDDKTREMIKLDRDKVMEELLPNNGKGGGEG